MSIGLRGTAAAVVSLTSCLVLGALYSTISISDLHLLQRSQAQWISESIDSSRISILNLSFQENNVDQRVLGRNPNTDFAKSDDSPLIVQTYQFDMPLMDKISNQSSSIPAQTAASTPTTDATVSSICQDRNAGYVDAMTYNQRHSELLRPFSSPLTAGKGYMDSGTAQAKQSGQVQ